MVDYLQNNVDYGGGYKFMPNLLVMKDITKTFPGTKALDEVSFNLEEGTIVGILGENGAGKSTLIKILVGALQQDTGKIYLKGNEKIFLCPRDAKKCGIHIIYQELELLNKLTVAENIVFPDFPKKNYFLDWKLLHSFTQKKLDSLGIDINSYSRVGELSIAKQQLVAITRAIASECQILVLDEPTSALTEKDINILFKILLSLKNKGIGIIFISHKLEEIKEITDKVTILRDGKVVGYNLDTKHVSIQELATLIVGKQFIKGIEHKRRKDIGEEKIRLEDINYKDIEEGAYRELKNINLIVRKGEIVGVGGGLGAGKTEISKVIFSSFSRKTKFSGKIYFNGEEVKNNSPYNAIRSGIGLIAENRAEVLFLKQDVKFNITITILEQDIVYKIKKALDIKFASIYQDVKNLSGGNKQKVLVSRWLVGEVGFLILDEPTRGIDVGAREEFYKIVNQLAEKDIAILLLSSDLSEIFRMADRMYILKKGVIKKEINRGDISLDELKKLVLIGE
jgi:ABC-type sugar transport system ATPase subunit